MNRPTLAELTAVDDFTHRHIGPDAEEQAQMLRTVGVASIEELLEQTVPTSIHQEAPIELPGPRLVEDVLAELRALAGRNVARTSLIGMGYSGTITPPLTSSRIASSTVIGSSTTLRRGTTST